MKSENVASLAAHLDGSSMIHRAPSLQTGGSSSLAIAVTANSADLPGECTGPMRVTRHVGSLTYTLCALLIHVKPCEPPCCHADLEIYTCSAECAAPSETSCQCRSNVGLSPILSILWQSHIRLGTIAWQGEGKSHAFRMLCIKTTEAPSFGGFVPLWQTSRARSKKYNFKKLREVTPLHFACKGH